MSAINVQSDVCLRGPTVGVLQTDASRLHTDSESAGSDPTTIPIPDLDNLYTSSSASSCDTDQLCAQMDVHACNHGNRAGSQLTSPPSQFSEPSQETYGSVESSVESSGSSVIRQASSGLYNINTSTPSSEINNQSVKIQADQYFTQSTNGCNQDRSSSTSDTSDGMSSWKYSSSSQPSLHLPYDREGGVIINEASQRTVLPGRAGERIEINLTNNSTKPVQIGTNNVMYVHKGAPPAGRHFNINPTKTKVELKVPNRQVTDNDIDLISRHLGNDWRSLGTKLEFVAGELDAFNHDYTQDGLREIIRQMLLSWREKYGPHDHLKIVVKALILIKRGNVANELCNSSHYR